MRYYIDCEFDGHNGPLLSLAMVAEASLRDQNNSIHIRVLNTPADPWVIANVLPIMDSHQARVSAHVYDFEAGAMIRAFIGEDDHPIIIADSPVDIGRFCRAISTGTDKQWVSTHYPRMTFEVHNVDCYPTTLEGAVQHNAWWDAMALRAKLTETTH